MNMRGRLQPPLPPDQLGNIVGATFVLRIQPNAMSLGHLAGHIRALHIR